MMNQTITSAQTNFYVTGGTLQRNAPSYVKRQADDELYEGLCAGNFCYVLTSRQMGKSSLMVRTAVRLRERGAAVAVIDLTAIGQNVSVEQWYDGLLSRIGQQLDLEDELEEFWLAHDRLGPLQRWMQALRQIVLPQRAGPIIIFIDEIDAVRSLPFPTDEFFAGLREFYNRRTEDPELCRLTFCLLGVATPSDLIRDIRTTPFNIGQRIELTDFIASEAAPLAEGLGRTQQLNDGLLQRILYWTGGHPYLTQKLCRTVAEDERITSQGGVDRLCHALFLSSRARESDDNLLFVRDRILRGEADHAALLDLYAQIRIHKKRVQDDKTNSLISILRLAGITRIIDGYHLVRNRIYYRVFDRAWVEANMPDAELRRQRSAERRGMLRAASAAALIFILLAGLAVIAYRQSNRADQQELKNRFLSYTQLMYRAQQDYENGDIARTQQILTELQHSPELKDLRSQDWYYLDLLCRSNRFSLDNQDKVNSVAFSPDGNTLAAGSNDGTCRLWDLTTRQALNFRTGHDGGIIAVGFSPDGHTLATGSADKTVKLWVRDGSRWRAAASLKGHTGQVNTIAFSPDGRLLATGSRDGTVKLWDVNRHEQAPRTLRTQDKNLPGWIESVAFSPDGNTVVAGTTHGFIQLWDVNKDEEPTLIGEYKKLGWLILCVAFSQDGKIIAAANEGGTIALWDVATKQPISTLEGHKCHVWTIKFSPDGRTLASGSTDKTVKLWDVPEHRLLATYMGHADTVRTVAFSPDGKMLATGSLDNSIKLWDVGTDKQVLYQRR